VTEFTSGISLDANPLGITAGADENVWFTEFGTPAVARIGTGCGPTPPPVPPPPVPGRRATVHGLTGTRRYSTPRMAVLADENQPPVPFTHASSAPGT
jgi:hypothetical protein